MSYTGVVPQAWVDMIGPHLSKNPAQGATLAEEWIRTNHELASKLMSTGKVNAAEKGRLPVTPFGVNLADALNAEAE